MCVKNYDRGLKVMSQRKKPTLRFGKTTGMTGFTAFSTASFSDLRPARIVRELLQNSLDAAVEAGEKTAIVRFRVTQVGRDDVPDIDGYEKAFRAAVDDHEKLNDGLPDAAQQVVDNIDEALKRLAQGTHHSLSVLDNGIGLNEKRMNSLLGDGTSVKSTEASGSYGVGHLASIPSSDLRYVLYGGAVKSGRCIVSGCAVLATRSGKNQLYAAQGYLVKGFRNGAGGKFYDFIDAESIPGRVATDLNEIKTRWGHGTTVVIPAFNYFGGDDGLSLWDIVSKVAAYNFNAAIHQGSLVIEIDEDDICQEDKKDGIRRLDKDTIGDVLQQERDATRVAYKGSFFEGLRPSGKNAHAAYLTQLKGERYHVQTDDGNVYIRLLTPSPTGSTRVDLYRNGMWIADEVRGLSRAEFTKQQPFHAVLTLNPREGKELHRLVRKAEGPMHNELEPIRLSREEKSRLKRAIQQIATWIKKKIPEVSTEEYTPDDFLVVETGGDQAGGDSKQYSMWGSPVVVQRARISQRRPSESDNKVEHERDEVNGNKKKRKRSGKKAQQNASRPLPFRSTVVPDGDGRHIIITLGCSDTFDEVVLSLRVDENMDATCDRIWPDENVLAHL